MVKVGGIIKGGASAGLRFGKIVKFFFFTVFIFLLIIHSVVLGFQEKSFRPVVVDLGKRAFQPVSELDRVAVQIKEQEGVYDSSKGVIRGGLNALFIYSDLLTPLFILFIWFNVLMKIFGWMTNVSVVINFILAVFAFYILQTLFLLYINWGSSVGLLEIMKIPIVSIWHFVQAFPSLFSPISDRFVVEDVENIANVVNNTNVTQ